MTGTAIVLLLAILAAAAAVLALRPDAEGLRERAGRLASARVLSRATQAGSVVEELRLASTSGLTARCAARAPSGTADLTDGRIQGYPGTGAPTRRHPGFLLAAGYETGRRAVTFPDVEGVVLLACDYPFEIPESPNAANIARALPELRRGVIDTPPILLLALDYLAARPDVDARAIGVVGASVGVPPAVVASALDERVRGVALLYGGADLPLLFGANVQLGSPLADRIARALVAVLTRPVEPARYAGRISPRPALAVNSPTDAYIPRASAEALHRTLREPREVRWLPLDHVAAFYERDLLARLTDLALGWFREQEPFMRSGQHRGRATG